MHEYENQDFVRLHTVCTEKVCEQNRKQIKKIETRTKETLNNTSNNTKLQSLHKDFSVLKRQVFISCCLYLFQFLAAIFLFLDLLIGFLFYCSFVYKDFFVHPNVDIHETINPLRPIIMNSHHTACIQTAAKIANAFKHKH